MRSLAAFVLTVLVLAGAPQARAAEAILRFDSGVKLAADGVLIVTETIRVRAEGREIRRGIFRDFPLTFLDRGGELRTVPFALLDVTRDGRPEPHFTESHGNRIRIYAGSKDVTLASGEHVYVFRYRTGRQVRWFDGTPELNWNVTGNFWNFPILAATYRLELPDSTRPLRWTAFTGRLGARGTDFSGAVGNDNILTVTTTRTLAPGEGLTVVAEIPQGIVSAPSGADELYYGYLDYKRWIFGGLGFLAVLLYYIFAWNAVGRDPKRGIVIPQFYPPDNVSPALANYISDWGFSDRWRAFTAASLSLAVKGLLLFNQDGKDLSYELTGKKPATAPQTGAVALPAGERAIYDWVEGQGGEAKIDKANGTSVAAVGSSFTKAIESESKNKFFRRNLGYALAGIAMTVVVVIGLFLFGGLRDEDIAIVAATGFGGLWLGMFLVPIVMTVFSGRAFASVVRGVMLVVVLGAFVAIFFNIANAALPGGVSALGGILLKLGIDNPYPLLLIGAFTTLNGLFIYLMRAPTALGRPIMDHLAGLKLYLETAEPDRMNLQAPEITTERFEALLPYAVALGVEKPWAEAFSAALARAHPGEPEPARVYSPSWGSGWRGGNLGSAVAASVAGANAAFASAVPASSGSSGFSSGGGGGGSGGGGGGGGGGGW
jgi:uncharacterized membrane protein YgcG